MKRSLYVSRPLLNGDELRRWAEAIGLATALAAKSMHATIAFSRTPMAWEEVPAQEAELQTRGGDRLVKRLGKATVLRFDSPHLTHRWRTFRQAGASYDHAEYQPHVTLTYAAPEALELAEVEPFDGLLRFGQERYQEVQDDWKGTTEEEPFPTHRPPARRRVLLGRRAA
jgi:hypothetical protein